MATHRLRSVVMGFVVVVVVTLVWAVTWFEGEANPGRQGAQTVIVVRDGSSVSAVIATLARQGVVGSSLAFHLYLTLNGTPTVVPGEYLLYRHESFGALHTALAGGPNVFLLAIPPGFSESETAQRVAQLPGRDATTFLAAAAGVRAPLEPVGSTNLDGLLGAGIYRVLPTESDTVLVQQMVDRFSSEAAAAGLDTKAAALGVTPYQAVVVASIVQKEGVYEDNDGKVARVIYNRLARGMPLQMDSTVLYSEHRDGGPVTSADLALNTPYNTYLHAGLTPTPICFPSAASLTAALSPTPGDWLYFVVVSSDGTEAFSSTLAGQEANERLAASRGLG